MVVLTPSHQFPLGGAMSPARRAEFIRWAKQANAWIIEDDYDSEFRYAGKPIPALSSFDHANRAIYIGSFSKIFSTGLRLGFLVAPPNLLDDFSQTLSRFESKTAITMQRVLSEFMDSGEFYRHIRRVRRTYAERRRTLMACLTSELGDVLSFDDYQAGMQFVAKLPSGYDDQQITKAARSKGVYVSPLSQYYAGKTQQKGLLIGFCGFTPKEIKQNIQILNGVLRQHTELIGPE